MIENKMDRFESAQKFATRLVDKYNLSPPVDPMKIILDLGCGYREESNSAGVEAYSELGDNPCIVINPEYTFPARKKFTAAHELAHLYIPWHNGDTKCNTDSPYYREGGRLYLDTQELEANIFASELLMPSEWVKQEIADFDANALLPLLKHIQKKAETSIMACFYALENALPSGHLIFVRKKYSDYWKRFTSTRTYSTRLFYDFNYSEDERNILDMLCISQEKFEVSQYDVIHYVLTECFEKSKIKNIYKMSSDLFECINILSEYNPEKILVNLQYVLESIHDVYSIFVCYDSKIIRRVSTKDSMLKCGYGAVLDFLETLENNDVAYSKHELKYGFSLVVIKEVEYAVPTNSRVNPNELLKQIVEEIYVDNHLRQRQSINGIVSSINSSNRNADEIELYNLIKYRFLSDKNLIDFYNHRDFDLYISNKVKDMIEKRSKRK